jgi:cellulose synthase/poly-beta-1,6-N-acetylglucosamine synthase-like glycosyltransferase
MFCGFERDISMFYSYAILWMFWLSSVLRIWNCHINALFLRQPMDYRVLDCMKVSVVAAAYNEGENVAPFLEGVRNAMSGFDYELVVVDDGSEDDTYGGLVVRGDERLRVIRLDVHRGKDYAIYTGFRNSSGDVIATIDSDLQDEPLDLPVLVRELDRG